MSKHANDPTYSILDWISMLNFILMVLKFFILNLYALYKKAKIIYFFLFSMLIFLFKGNIVCQS